MARRGRPKSSPLTRDEQLRRAKRAQRARQRAAGIVHVQLALPQRTAAKLAAAQRATNLVAELDPWLDQFAVRLADFPALRDIAWNRAQEFIPAREALGLYERNWRFVDQERLQDHERQLIERLVARFGRGVFHA